MGKVIDDSRYPEQITLGECQMCVRFWDGRGVLALAGDGPDNCRITKPLEKNANITDCTGAFEISEQALTKWKECPWV